MTNWFINFCAPFIPNDPTINFHRRAQAVLLLSYTLFYATLHIYYTYCASSSEEAQNEGQSKPDPKKAELETQSNHSTLSHKEANLKCDDQNDSGIELKKSRQSDKKQTTELLGPTEKAKGSNFDQIKQYFPIVYGHFAISMGMSIMYTPYAEQSIAATLYILLTVALLITSSKKSRYGIRAVWVVMSIILMFMFLCGLLEVGQSNWDILNLDCFSNEYVSLYA